MGESGTNSTDKVVGGIMTFIIAFVMICSAAIPIVSGQINGLSALIGTDSVPQVIDIAGIQSLLVVGIILMVLGVIYGVVRKFILSDR